MTRDLEGCRVAFVATDGVEQVELTEPMRALKEAGATVELIAPQAGHIQGWNHHDKGDRFPVDKAVERADADAYDALVLPGGVINPDALRLQPAAMEFIRAFVQAGKPIAAICHGPWTLIDAGAVVGYRMTSWPSLKMDLLNAGATWVDEEVVRDNRLVTSRKPDDLPAFCRETIALIADTRRRASAAAAQ